MVQEAELNADADRRAQELIELKNKAESLAYQTEKTVKDLGDKIDEASRQSATEKVEALRNALKGDNQDDIQAAFNALESESHGLSEKLYANVAQADGGKTHPGGEDVIDAEFKEEK
jgi:molecular chaperone DnaK